MIVRYESDGSIVMITQNDHAQLSGLFAAHWGNDAFEKPHPYESAVRAAMFHDRGWICYETGPRLNKDTGKTPNYREVPNDAQQLEAFEWAGDWLSSIDAYAGLLISKHRTGLWQSRYGVMRQPPRDPARQAERRHRGLYRAQRGQAKGSRARSRSGGVGEELPPAPGLGPVIAVHLQPGAASRRTRSSRCRPATRMPQACAWSSRRSMPQRSLSTLSVRSAIADRKRHLPKAAQDHLPGRQGIAGSLFRNGAADCPGHLCRRFTFLIQL